MRELLRGRLPALLLLLSAAMLSSSALAAPSFELPSERFTWSDIAVKRHSSEGYGEKYTFDAKLKSAQGETGLLYLSLMITNLGPGDHKMTAKGRLTLGERSVRWSYKLDADEWSSRAKPLNIRAGGVTLREENGALIAELKHKKLSFKLAMKERGPNWQPHGGGFKLGSHYSTLQTAPLMDLSGELSFLGDSPHSASVTGQAWGSHSASDQGPHEQSLWMSKIRSIDLKSARTLYMRVMQSTEDYGSQQLAYLFITEGDKLIFEGSGFPIKVDKSYTDSKKYGYRVAEDFTVDIPHAQDPKLRLKGRFKTIKRTRRRDPIAKRSWAERVLIKRFSKPMEYRYKLGYELSLSGPAGERALKGQADYEIFHFNKD